MKIKNKTDKGKPIYFVERIMAYLQEEISQEAVMRLLNVSEDEFDDLVSIYNQ